MFKIGIPSAALCFFAVPALAADMPTPDWMLQDATTAQATIAFLGNDGSEIGTGVLTQTAEGVLVQAEVNDLQPDMWHAFHIHEKGVCDAENGFKTAGGHFAPEGHAHGYLAENGAHAGDMPNQYVPASGTLKTQILNDAVTLADAKNGIDGHAIVIHAGADDYKSQPSGAAGSRLACGIIHVVK